MLRYTYTPRKSEANHVICAELERHSARFDGQPVSGDPISPCVFPLDDGIFSEDHLLPDHPQQADLVSPLFGSYQSDATLFYSSLL